MIALQILIYMYDKIKGTLHLNKITLLRNPHSGQADCVRRTNSAGLPSYGLRTTPSLHYPGGKNSPLVPSFRRSEEKPNERLQSWFHQPHLKCGSMRTKNPSTYCAPLQRADNRMLSVGVSPWFLHNGRTRLLRLRRHISVI